MEMLAPKSGIITAKDAFSLIKDQMLPVGGSAIGLGPSLKIDPLFQIGFPLLLSISILLRGWFKRTFS
ncbi:hypothetical protein NSS79_05860 [Paenibacillus sp. FSL L8-0436]|uniref:hypothetical protein n=1 Tax=Paenibacillus sp. FSL L8-0436 TaxID=2954686 RepID=UPI0031580399